MVFNGLSCEIKTLISFTNPNGVGFLFGGTVNGKIIRWTAVGDELNNFKCHNGHAIICLAVTDEYIFSGGGDGTIIQHKHQGEEIKTFDYHSREWIRSLTVQGDSLISTSNDNNLIVLPSFTAEEPNPTVCSGHTDWVTSHVSFGGFIFTGSYDKSIRQWSTTEESGYATSFKYNGHSNHVTSVAIAAGLLVSSSRDETVKFWRINSDENPGELVANLTFGCLLRFLVSDLSQLYVVTSENTVTQLSTPDLAQVITVFGKQNHKAYQSAKKTIEEGLATAIKKLEKKRDRKVRNREKELRAAAAAAAQKEASAQKAEVVEGEEGAAEEEEAAEDEVEDEGAAPPVELSEADVEILNKFKEERNSLLETSTAGLQQEYDSKIKSLIRHTVYEISPKDFTQKPFIIPRISAVHPISASCLLVTPTSRDLFYSQESTVSRVCSNLNTLPV